MIALDNASTLARSAAASNGISLSAEAIATAAARLAADLTHDENRQLAFSGAAPFRIEGGQVVDLGLAEHVIAVVRELGSPAAPASTPETPAKPTHGEPVSSFGKAFAAAEHGRMVAETATYRNPWKDGQLNRTHQVLISKYNPAIAARYKVEAGA